MRQKHLVSVAILIIGLSLVGCKHYPPTPSASEIPAGFDAFKTDEKGTSFQFDGEFGIPAGFFDEDSKRFAGTVSLRGVPLGSFKGQQTDADAVVERTKPAKLSTSYGTATATVPIVLTALSLESTEPIKVAVGKDWQLWKMKVELSPSRASNGSMTLSREKENGGTFSSELAVYPLFTFTRQSDGAVKKLDVGAMKLSADGVEQITLRSRATAWSSSSRQEGSSRVFNPGDGASFPLISPRIRHIIIIIIDRIIL